MDICEWTAIHILVLQQILYLQFTIIFDASTI